MNLQQPPFTSDLVCSSAPIFLIFSITSFSLFFQWTNKEKYPSWNEEILSLVLILLLPLLLTCRSFSSLEPSEGARASYLYRQWVGLGLSDVRISNHTVLLSLPGSTPNTITDRSSHQCFLPYGVPCDQHGLNEQEFSYAAYSASGSVQVLCPACLMTFVNQRSLHPPGRYHVSPPTHCLYHRVARLNNCWLLRSP